MPPPGPGSSIPRCRRLAPGQREGKGGNGCRDPCIDLLVEVAAKLVLPRKVNVTVAYHNFQLHEATGRWSNTGGTTTGAGWDPNNTDHRLGNEIDVVVHLTPWDHFSLQPGYGIFMPAGAGKALGGDSPQQFAYLWAIAEF